MLIIIFFLIVGAWNPKRWQSRGLELNQAALTHLSKENQSQITGLSNKKAYDRVQKFKLWLEWWINFEKCNENFAFRLRRIHNAWSLTPINETVRNFKHISCHQQKEFQHTFRLVKQDILVTLPIHDTPLDNPPFNDVMAPTPIGSQAFRDLCMNLTYYVFNTSSWSLSYERKSPFYVVKHRSCMEAHFMCQDHALSGSPIHVSSKWYPQKPASLKLFLILPLLIVCICFENGVVTFRSIH